VIEATAPVTELLNLGGRVALMTGASGGVGVGIAGARGEVGAGVVVHRSQPEVIAARGVSREQGRYLRRLSVETRLQLAQRDDDLVDCVHDLAARLDRAANE
jgi:NAD(P)-dependent dehydrogenase (short-subunit alcohol dehydrogenase family)